MALTLVPEEILLPAQLRWLAAHPQPNEASIADAAVRRCIAACQVIIIDERDDPTCKWGAIQCRDALVALLTATTPKAAASTNGLSA